MNTEQRFRSVLRTVNSFLIFFLLTAFVITSCMLLFLSVFSAELGIDLNNENIEAAAKLTFGNVILISLILTGFDTFRRHFTVDRPVTQILDAAEKMAEGDFSVRIPTANRFLTDDKFNDIIRCINKMAEELAGIETLRTDFVSNVSHEMKTPLSVIQNYTTLLSDTDLSEEKRVEYTKTIMTAAHRLSDMMTNILKLNRLENQQIYPKAELYDLSSQLCESLLQFEETWEQKGITIETDIEDDVHIQADEELLALVWNNLLSNAFKFTERGGRVTLTLKASADSVTVKIKDTGCGMTAEVGAHIFEKFYQGDTSHATQGNGLGLALVKRVISILQGEIAVESTLGAGTTFTVTLKRFPHGH